MIEPKDLGFESWDVEVGGPGGDSVGALRSYAPMASMAQRHSNGAGYLAPISWEG